MVPVKSLKVLSPLRVPSHLAHLQPDPVISLIHWVRNPSGLGFGQNGGCGLDSGFWLSSSSVGGTVWVAIVMWQL